LIAVKLEIMPNAPDKIHVFLLKLTA